MDHDDVLSVLKSDEALHKKFTGKQLLMLAIFTLVVPIIALFAVGISLS